MNISPDYLIERKRNKSQLTKWKLFSVVLVVIIFVILAPKYLLSHDLKNVVKQAKGDYIATILIEDILIEDSYRMDRLKEIEEDDKIKALVVNINSPGGGVVASEMIYNALRKISSKKPVVTLMLGLAASGGYMIALGGDYIVGHNGTITGSIGVIMQSAEVTDLAEKLGIKFENFKTSEYKASPNPTEKVTPEVRKVMMETIKDVYDYFTELVAVRRKLDIDYVRSIADGRIYSGRQALNLKLIDEIGDEDTAVNWLKEKRKIPSDLRLVEVSLKPKDKLMEMLLEDLNIKIFSIFRNKIEGLKSIAF